MKDSLLFVRLGKCQLQFGINRTLKTEVLMKSGMRTGGGFTSGELAKSELVSVFRVEN